MFSISVIVRTRKPRKDYLGRALEALHSQDLPKDQWELLLVGLAGDGSLSDRFDISWHPHGRYFLEEKAGKTDGLIRAIAESNGELLVVVDDDNVLRTDFLSAALKIGAEYPELGAWGGSCLPEFEIPPPEELKPWLSAVFNDKLKTSYYAKLPRDTEALPAGAGIVVRRKQALHYRDMVLHDPLRQALFRNGQRGSGWEDCDLARCAFDLGLGTGRFPELELTRLIPVRKLNLPYSEALFASFGYSGMVVDAVRSQRKAHPRKVPTSLLRCWLLRAYLLFSGKSRTERRIRMAMEKGKLRAVRELQRAKSSIGPLPPD